MNPCTFSLFCKRPELHEDAYIDIKNTLISNGFSVVEQNPEMIVVLGGDGSLLKAFHDFSFHGKFILINTGHLGFFSDYSIQNYKDFLDDATRKEAEIESLPLLSIQSNHTLDYVVSDLAIQSERTCLLKVSVNNVPLTEVRSNGIVIGTKAGSSGYLLSLGSPAIIHSNDVYQYHMIAPVYNRLFPNPINSAIISKDDTLSITIASGEATIILDGIPQRKAVNETFDIKMTQQNVSTIHFRPITQISRIRHAIRGED